MRDLNSDDQEMNSTYLQNPRYYAVAYIADSRYHCRY
jgi:hypothetical protein